MAAEATQEGGTERELLTLSEVAEKAGISMPTAAKYKRKHQDRIPSEGKGRTQRYPEDAVTVFQEIYQENLSKRGRAGASKAASKRKKKAAAKGRAAGRKKAKRGKAAETEGLMTLKDLAAKAGVSYPTAQNYVRKHLDRIPHEGRGRTRKYPEESVAAVREIYQENLAKRGGARQTAKPKKGSRARSRAAAGPADKRLVSALEKLERRMASLEKLMKKPLKVEIRR